MGTGYALEDIRLQETMHNILDKAYLQKAIDKEKEKSQRARFIGFHFGNQTSHCHH
jgi:hypothetical protein